MLDILKKWGIEIKEKLHFKRMQNALLLLSVSGGAEMGPDVQKGFFFFGSFLLAIGLLALIYPRLFWYLRVGRKIVAKGATPGRLYLAVLRCGGLLLCALAIWMFLNSRGLPAR